MRSADAFSRRAALASMLLAATGVAGKMLVPTRLMAHQRSPFKLESDIPVAFGAWRMDPNSAGGIINPQTEALLNRLYSQLLSRVYLRGDGGGRIMLSIAYGEDQSAPDVALHYPEVCYPAQGFQVHSNRKGAIRLPSVTLPVRRLETSFAEKRFEPVTYWTMVGDQPGLGGWDRRVAMIRHGLSGAIADGLLVRASSIDRNSDKAFALQEQFVADLVHALVPDARARLIGSRQA